MTWLGLWRRRIVCFTFVRSGSKPLTSAVINPAFGSDALHSGGVFFYLLLYVSIKGAFSSHSHERRQSVIQSAGRGFIVLLHCIAWRVRGGAGGWSRATLLRCIYFMLFVGSEERGEAWHGTAWHNTARHSMVELARWRTLECMYVQYNQVIHNLSLPLSLHGQGTLRRACLVLSA